MSGKSIDKMVVNELKQELSNRGLSTKGLKAELQKRLKDAIDQGSSSAQTQGETEETAQKESSEPNKSETETSTHLNHVEGGLKAAITNENTSEEAKEKVQAKLDAIQNDKEVGEKKASETGASVPAPSTPASDDTQKKAEASEEKKSNEKKPDEKVEEKKEQETKSEEKKDEKKEEFAPQKSEKPAETKPIKEETTPMETEENRKRKIETTTKSAEKSATEKKPKLEEKREVPPSKFPASSILYITNFVRPFTKQAVETLLAATGRVSEWSMDGIKSKAYVIYSTEAEATATREALHNLVWPPNNRSKLNVEYSTKNEAQQFIKANSPTTSQPTPAPSTTSKRERSTDEISERKRQASPQRERPAKKVDPVKTLDDIFKKTNAKPHIYYLPLTEEEVKAKYGNAQEKEEPKVEADATVTLNEETKVAQ